MFSAIVNKGTDEEFLITGYRRSWIRTFLSLTFSLLLGGIPLLVAKWKPDWKLFFTSVQCRLKSATRCCFAFNLMLIAKYALGY